MILHRKYVFKNNYEFLDWIRKKIKYKSIDYWSYGSRDCTLFVVFRWRRGKEE